MKKKHSVFFGIAVLLTAAMFTITGCDNGSTDPGGGGTDPALIAILREKYVGTTWRLNVNDSKGYIQLVCNADGYTLSQSGEMGGFLTGNYFVATVPEDMYFYKAQACKNDPDTFEATYDNGKSHIKRWFLKRDGSGLALAAEADAPKADIDQVFSNRGFVKQ